ncbi:uncharacterized protein LOC133181119 [Saccostrea echinata]|uniref:uncharacterized protein LOC133181119 n=1 Tax=Saccostrea echinata TaxID=191078 RepID=UPI002A7ED924|nr:uncharacterized protein LOC133181119 [Saccostrea echinata]
MEPSTTTLSLEVCHSDSTFIPIEKYNISSVVFNETSLKNENCSQEMLLGHRVLFNNQMNVSLRCTVHGSDMNTPLSTDCEIPDISTALVVAVMDTSSHVIMIQTTIELLCHFNVSSFEWEAVRLDFQNESLISQTIVSVTNSSKTSNENRINASLSVDSYFVNVSFVLDFATSKDACSLSGMYTCSIDMVDKHIATESASTVLNFSAPVSDITLHLRPQYQYGTDDFINCSAKTMEPSTTTLSLEVCHSDSTFIPIEKYNISSVVFNETSLKNENCSQEMLLGHRVLFNNQMNVSLRCTVHGSDMNTPLSTDCEIPDISTALVVAVMDTSSHVIMIQTTIELLCHFNVSSFEWEAVRLDFQNESLISQTIVSVTNSSKTSNENRINASLSVDSYFVNVSFVLDFATSKDACSLSGMYTCSIDMVDKHIATESASTVLNFSAPVSDITLHLRPQYQYGTDDFINCSAKTMEPSTTTLSLEVCHSDSTFIPIEKYNISSVVFNETSLKNENCSQEMLLGHRVLFNNQMNVSLRCTVHGSDMNTPLSTDCEIPDISTALVVAVMDTSSHVIMIQTTIELLCHFNVSSFEWEAVRLDFQNESLISQTIVSVTNSSKTSNENRINASLSVDSYFVNVSFVLDFATSKDACSLSGMYTCSIDMVDKHIATESASTVLNFSAPVSDITLHLRPQYQYGTDDFINCSAKTMEPSTTSLSLEVCHSDSTFTPIQDFLKTSAFNETSLKNENYVDFTIPT